MIAGFAVRSCGALATSGAGAAALICAVTGCSGDSLLIGQERPRFDPGADDPGGLGGAATAPAPTDVALLSDCPPSPEERQALLGCWPTRHVGVWRGFFIGIPRYRTLAGESAEFPPGDVLLEVAVDGAARLTFGAASQALAGEPPLVVCPPRDAAPGCPTPGLLLAGFAYEVGALALFDPAPAVETRVAGEPPPELGERMTFVVHVSEPWDRWCSTLGPEPEGRCTGGDCSAGEALPAPGAAIDSAPPAPSDPDGCRCDASGCRAEEPMGVLSISLQMSGDGEALRGSFLSYEASLGEASLELRRAAR